MAQIAAELLLWIFLELIVRGPGYAIRRFAFGGRPINQRLTTDASDVICGFVFWFVVAIAAWLTLRSY